MSANVINTMQGTSGFEAGGTMGRPLASTAEALARVAEMAPRVAARAAQAEADRRVPAATVDELHDAGLFNLLVPKAFGGAELGLQALVKVTAALAEECGSTGWLFGVLAGHSWMLNLFPIDAQREVLSDPKALTATLFRLSAKVEPVPGGYRMTEGAGQFCSGVDHASWVLVGNAVPQDNGPPEQRFFLVPRSDIEIVDDWFTGGMRATGSKSIRIASAIVPEHRTVRVKDMLDGTSPGAGFLRAPMYRMPFADIVPFSLIGAPIGIARGALRRMAAPFEERLAGADADALGAAAPTLVKIAEASADLDAAAAMILADAAWLDNVTDPDAIPAADRAKLPRDWAYAAQTARRSVNRVFEQASGNTIYSSNELQRFWRDVNGAAQHHAFRWDTAMLGYGHALIGRSVAGYNVRTKH